MAGYIQTGRKAGALLLLLFLLAACGLTQEQREATKAFSGAAETLGDAAAKEFPTLRQQIIEMNATSVALHGALGNKQGFDNLDQAADLDVVSVRVRAARLLESYGGLLHKLASDSRKEDLEKAAGKLTDALDGLPEGYKVADSDQLSAVGKLVAGIGFLLVEEQKARVIKQIVSDYAEQVKTVARLLRDDFSRTDPKLVGQLITTRVALTSVARNALNKGKGADAAARALVLVQSNIDRVETVLAKASEAAGKTIAAHAALEEALLSNKVALDDIRAFAKSVESLVGAVEDLT